MSDGYLTDIEAMALQDNAMKALERCAAHERHAVEQALSGWVAQCGVTPEVFGRHFGYTVERSWSEDGAKFSVSVKPVLLGSVEPDWATVLCGS